MSLSIVPLESKYFEFVRELRNDPRVKVGFISQEEISVQAHIEYMNEFASSYYICLRDNKAVGYFGIIDNDIRLATLPDEMNTGVGKFMVDFIVANYPGAFAKVKFSNVASRKLFEKCGFTVEYFIYTRKQDD